MLLHAALHECVLNVCGSVTHVQSSARTNFLTTSSHRFYLMFKNKYKLTQWTFLDCRE